MENKKIKDIMNELKKKIDKEEIDDDELEEIEILQNEFLEKMDEINNEISHIQHEVNELEKENEEIINNRNKNENNDDTKPEIEKSKEETINAKFHTNTKIKKVFLIVIVFLGFLGAIYIFKNSSSEQVKEEKFKIANVEDININDFKEEDQDIAIDNEIENSNELIENKNRIIIPSNDPAVAYYEIDKRDLEKKYKDKDKDIAEIDNIINSLENREPQQVVNNNVTTSTRNRNNSMNFIKKTENTNKSKDDPYSVENIVNSFLGTDTKNNSTNDKKTQNTNSNLVINRIIETEENSLLQGSIIPAVLISEINTDLPGDIIAQVRENVYDTATGKNLVIPKGSKLYGRYNAQIVNNQNRVMIAFDKLILPNGKYVNLTAFKGTDLSGATGVNDKVNNHTFDLLRNAFLTTVLNLGNTVASGVSFKLGNVEVGLNGKTKEDKKESPFEKQTSKILERSVDRKPTLEIRKGFLFNIMVSEDLVLEKYK